jgi:hypothetical protein
VLRRENLLDHAQALLLSQAEEFLEDRDPAEPRESGAADAGLRRASLSPQSKTLSRSRGRRSFLSRSLVRYCMVTAIKANSVATRR